MRPRGEEKWCFLSWLHIFSIQVRENTKLKKDKGLVRLDFFDFSNV